VDEKFQMENEEDGGDWKRMKNWELQRTKKVIFVPISSTKSIVFL
jgi:hypothetical protein